MRNTTKYKKILEMNARSLAKYYPLKFQDLQIKIKTMKNLMMLEAKVKRLQSMRQWIKQEKLEKYLNNYLKF